jgi:hypothetical protein
MRNLLLLLLCLLSSVPGLFSQNLYTYWNSDYDMEVQSALYSSRVRFHTAIQAWRVGDIEKITNYDSLNQVNRLERTIEKKWKQKAWDKFLNDDVITLYREKFWFAVNPLMNFDIGYEANEAKSRYINTRGFEAKGEIGKGFSFYTSFYENQGTFVNYLDSNIRETRIVPGQGMIRTFKEGGFDYASAQGYIAWNAGKYFDFQLGYDRNFVGDGYRSLLISDNAFNYPFLKITAKFWHINYMVIYSQMMDINFKWSDDLGYARKWTTTHYLSWAASRRFSIGIFESVVWQTQDSTGYRGFDVGYLSPIIFLRPVEFSSGSPDNALIGINMSFIVGKHSTFYGQLILDEFKLNEYRENNGWWGNKFGWQLGFKSFNIFGIKNLFFQTEFNWVRPYTYAHERAITNYGHYNAGIAHPLGANFWESVSFIKYNYRRFYFRYQFQYAQYGLDEDDKNYGKDIYKPYTTRVSDYDVKVGQGLLTTVLYNDVTVSWLINPAYNLNIAIGYTHRLSSNEQRTVNTSFIHFGLRTSLNRFYYDL